MNKRTIRRLYEDYAFFIHRRCLRLLGSEAEAEDALHEVFLRLMDHAEKLEQRETLLPWLNRVTTNHCLSLLRKRKVRRFEPDALAQVPDRDAGLFEALLERQDLVAWLVANASEDQGEVATRYFLHEESVDAIAEALSISTPTVRRRIRGFLEAAREQLNEERTG